jgi:hypothetical protein
MPSTMSKMCGLALCLCLAVSVQAGDPRPVAQPWGGTFELGEPSYPMFWDDLRIPIDHLVLGADHIIDQQCANGGFGWPHGDCSETKHNITGPILLGVLAAYAHSSDGHHLAGALNGGAFDLVYTYDNGESRFSTFSAIFFHDLALWADNSTFSTHVSVKLFDELAAGTFGPDDFDTAGWIANIENGRSGALINLRPWEFHTLIPAADALGQPGQSELFEQAVLDGLGTLDNSDPGSVYSDVIGLAGGVRGLAAARRLVFPTISAPLHGGVDGLDSLEALAGYLASLQNPNGSWDWHSGLSDPTEADEDTQTTAYALLALLDADVVTAMSYQPATEAARNWIQTMQLPDGGYLMFPGGGENVEVEGEAVSAVAAFDARIFVDGFEAGDPGLWAVVAP